jgi:hypothetical protein
VRSIFLYTFFAEITEIWCSVDLPPNITPTIFFIGLCGLNIKVQNYLAALFFFKKDINKLDGIAIFNTEPGLVDFCNEPGA